MPKKKNIVPAVVAGTLRGLLICYIQTQMQCRLVVSTESLLVPKIEPHTCKRTTIYAEKKDISKVSLDNVHTCRKPNRERRWTRPNTWKPEPHKGCKKNHTQPHTYTNHMQNGLLNLHNATPLTTETYHQK